MAEPTLSRVDLMFTRTGIFQMEGRVSVDVEDPNDLEAVYAKAEAQAFSEYLPSNVDYDTTDWSFETSPAEDT